MSKFETLFPIVLSQEVSKTNPEGLVDIPGDTGGLTKWGVSSKEWSRIRHNYVGFPEDVRYLTFDQAKVIYQKGFYLPICEVLPPGPALVVFDCQFNQGLGIRVLQRALKVSDDGIVGPKTLAALRLAGRDIPKLVEDLLWQRLDAYRAISKGSITNQGFLVKFWIPRLLSIRNEAHKLRAE